MFNAVQKRLQVLVRLQKIFINVDHSAATV